MKLLVLSTIRKLKVVAGTVKKYLYNDKNDEVQLVESEMYKLKLADFSCLIDQETGMAGHLLFLYNLTRETKSKNIIEIGLGGANSAIAFLLALKSNRGKLISIDCNPKKEAIERIKNLRFEKNWELLEGFSQEVVNKIPKNLKIDILLIDGKHSYNQCKLDYKLYEPMVKNGGFILFHDSAIIKGVIKFTNKLKKELPECLHLPYCNGIFMVRKTW